MMLLLVSWLIGGIGTETRAQTVICQGSPILEGFVIVADGHVVDAQGLGLSWMLRRVGAMAEGTEGWRGIVSDACPLVRVCQGKR